MAALNKFMKVMLSALFRGRGFRDHSLPDTESSFEIARTTGNVFVSVVVGVCIFVLGVGLLGYALLSFSGEREVVTVPAFKIATEEPTGLAEKLSATTSKDTTTQDAPSLASEPEEPAPMLRRSARIREKTARAAKKTN